MVRLVFRPYTQLRRPICTSESLLTSTAVSSGFVPTGNSSPSFGSQRGRSRYTYSCPRRAPRSSERGSSDFALTSTRGYRDTLSARVRARLLGPCFKTGRMEPHFRSDRESRGILSSGLRFSYASDRLTQCRLHQCGWGRERRTTNNRIRPGWDFPNFS